MLTQQPRHACRTGPLVSSAVPDASDRFISAYLDGELHEFFDCPLPPETGMDGVPEERPRTELAALLAGEAARLGAHEAVLGRAARLGEPGSAAIVAGQQAGLLLGPSYTLSKAAGACRFASRLNAAGSAAVAVPVFWLASQDHDAAEINHTYLLDLNEELHRLEVALPVGVPAGETPFRHEWLEQMLAGLGAGAWEPEHLTDISLRLETAAGHAETWADFFTAFFYSLLGESAPLMLDPTIPEIADLFRSVLEHELEDPLAGPAAINEAGRRLQRNGHAPQLGRGSQATNLFVTETREGGLPQRELLRFDGTYFFTGAHRYTKKDLLAVLAAEPGRLTPAAGLRPVAQDAVLPTATFYVGAGELRYLAQLRDVYRQHGVRQPVMKPRPHVTVLDPPVRRILRGFGLTAASYLSDPDGQERRLLLELSGADRLFQEAQDRLLEAREEMRRAVLGFEPTLERSVDRYLRRSLAGLETLADKAAAAARRREDTLGRQFRRLRAHLLPGGGKQERMLSPVSHFLKFGVDPLLRLYLDVPESGNVFLEP